MNFLQDTGTVFVSQQREGSLVQNFPEIMVKSTNTKLACLFIDRGKSNLSANHQKCSIR